MSTPAQSVFDVVVVGGGPAGATAATDLARAGVKVLLLDRAGRIKPCGGAIPPQAIKEFDIPDKLLVARINKARMVSPSARQVDMPIDGGFVGMVDREHFDEWLRERAALSGAERRTGTFVQTSRDTSGELRVHYRAGGADSADLESVVTRVLIGADGARSEVARQCVPNAEQAPFVYAYHEIVRSPRDGEGAFEASRCDVHYCGKISPDFYGWVFPHGDTTSIGVGTAEKGPRRVRRLVALLHRQCGARAGRHRQRHRLRLLWRIVRVLTAVGRQAWRCHRMRQSIG